MKKASCKNDIGPGFIPCQEGRVRIKRILKKAKHSAAGGRSGHRKGKNGEYFSRV